MSYKSEIVGIEETKTINNLSISDISSGSPVSGQVLGYNGTGWSPVSLSGEKCGSFIWARTSWRSAGGSSYSYIVDSNNSPPREIIQNSMALGDFDSKIVESDSRYDWGEHHSWYSPSYPRPSGFYVPPGTWHCRATIGGYSNNSGYAVVRWAKGPDKTTAPSTSNITPFGPKFYSSPKTGKFAQIPTAIVTTTDSTTLLLLEVIELSNFYYGYGNLWMDYITISILKI